MKYFFSGSSLQNKRSSNMDSLLLKQRSIDRTTILLAVVCDGVGSLADGAFASAIAAKRLSDWFEQLTDVERVGLRLRDTILAINEHVCYQAKRRGIRTASTLTALLLADGMYYVVHVGDSRAYMTGHEGLQLLTKDDTSPEGRLTAYIGREKDVVLQYLEGNVRNGHFLLCSDGLYKRLNESFLLSQLSLCQKGTLDVVVRELMRHVIARGEEDNISLALIGVER